MKICFTRKEVLAMLRHMAEQEDGYDKSILLEVTYGGGIGVTTHIVNEDGTEEDITDYSVW